MLSFRDELWGGSIIGQLVNAILTDFLREKLNTDGSPFRTSQDPTAAFDVRLFQR
jgi:hypothetical protein